MQTSPSAIETIGSVTLAVLPPTSVGCILGSRMPPFEMVKAGLSGGFRHEGQVTTVPCPEIPLAPVAG